MAEAHHPKNWKSVPMSAQEHTQIIQKIQDLYDDLFAHDGYGQMQIEMRFLKKGQKEIILHCGKEYRYVVDFPSATENPPVTKRRKISVVQTK